jgi:hypothetical protein
MKSSKANNRAMPKERKKRKLTEKQLKEKETVAKIAKALQGLTGKKKRPGRKVSAEQLERIKQYGFKKGDPRNVELGRQGGRPSGDVAQRIAKLVLESDPACAEYQVR